MNSANPDWPVLIRRICNAGYTQKRLAEACGVHENTISNLARGKQPQPSYSLGYKLVGLYNTFTSSDL